MAEPDNKATSVVTGDSGPGTGIADLLPIPSTTQPLTDPESKETSASMNQAPTLSHALAVEEPAAHEGKGFAQEEHDEPDVRDLGWNEQKEDVPAPLVRGIDNEELWLLVRRFNKQMYHVKALPYAPPGGLDLNIADEEEFSPDKLRANLERLYTTIIVGVLAAVKHVARLRSWRETRRTSAFCAVSEAEPVCLGMAWQLILNLGIFHRLGLRLHCPSNCCDTPHSHRRSALARHSLPSCASGPRQQSVRRRAEAQIRRLGLP
jgi:hypothetical protein